MRSEQNSKDDGGAPRFSFLCPPFPGTFAGRECLLARIR